TLMEMRALTAAARAICYACAFAADMAARSGETRWQERVDLLTPIAKAFSTDLGVHVASLGVQVHGGMGYIEETGAAQILRDARIAPIYEGTNGIQAIDLLTRKLPRGECVGDLIAELREVAEQARAVNRPDFGQMASRLGGALDDLATASAHLRDLLSAGKEAEALAGATAYLKLFGLAAGGAYLGKGALAALKGADNKAAQHIATARFFAEHALPETAALRAQVVEGADAVLAADPAAWVD
ncbi:MAG: acyl-CoA dehydrogenase, partial [Gammaproteobacteria bacterium]|nr:acyl-CoA dehydrogenase [Gammaproteobacteria bacterium]